MTKRDFEALAAMVRSIEEKDDVIGYSDLARMLADVCEASNPRFNRARFLAACRAQTADVI